jgi:hypothetical protein
MISITLAGHIWLISCIISDDDGPHTISLGEKFMEMMDFNYWNFWEEEGVIVEGNI